jgi:hypothetical protein
VFKSLLVATASAISDAPSKQLNRKCKYLSPELGRLNKLIIVWYLGPKVVVVACCCVSSLTHCVAAVQHKSLEAAVAKDAKDGATIASSTFASLNKKLSEKFKHIEALNAKYQQVRRVWGRAATVTMAAAHTLAVVHQPAASLVLLVLLSSAKQVSAVLLLVTKCLRLFCSSCCGLLFARAASPQHTYIAS